jgi:hypothetical protein
MASISESEAIHQACAGNDIINLVLLLDAGANPYAINKEGKSLQEIAKTNGFYHAHDILLSYAIRKDLPK